MFEDKNGDNTVTNDEVIQRYYYYPFGAETKNAPWTQQTKPKIRYQYNGKEKIDELGLGWNDYGARNYDALLGRWMGVDALAEKYVGYSGYNYVMGNPISLIDPDGRSVETCPTCPNTPEYDEARNSKSVFTYHKEEGILTNGDAEVEVKSNFVHLRDIGLETWNEKSDPYSENYNPNAVIKNDWLDRAYYFGHLVGFMMPSAKLARGAEVAINLIPEGKLANHLFVGAGKIADSPVNRALIQKLANTEALGVDAFGKSWYIGMDGAGKSIYTYTQNGIVKGAGYATMNSEEMILKYGLKQTMQP